MPNVRFILKDPKSRKETLIYLIIRFNCNTLKLSTREKIHKKFWNPLTRRARETRDNPEYSGLNTRLNNLESNMKAAYWSLLNNKVTPTPQNLKTKFFEEMGIELKDDSITLFEFIEKFIEQRKVTVRPNTIKKYKTTEQHLKDYTKDRATTLNFDDINLDFYYDFLSYMRIDLSFADNTIGKYIKTLKTFLNEATDIGYNTKTDFKSKRFTPPKEDVDKIYLTEVDLNKLYDLDLSKDPKLERVRDSFVLECYIGQRFSDMENLHPDDIRGKKGKQIITLRTVKTGEKVSIPLHSRALEIIKKYDNNFPPTITNQKTNMYLKDIGKEAKLNETYLTAKNKNGIKVKKRKEKWKLITTHTARRSFATNLYLAGIPVLSIMKMTGHKTEKSFMGYICMTSEENAQKLIEHDFFKEKRLLRVVNLKT